MDENRDINNTVPNGTEAPVPPQASADTVLPSQAALSPQASPAQVYGAYSYTPNNAYRNFTQPKAEQSQPSVKKSGRTFGIGTVIVCIILSVVISAASSVLLVLGLTGNGDKDKKSTASADIPETASTGEGKGPGSSSSQPTVISVEETVESLVEAVYDKASSSVVGIRTTASVQNFFYGTSQNTEEGSGVIYTSDGYIITNYHVIESVVKYSSSNSSVEVFFPSDPDTPVEAEIVGYYVSADLAVIKVKKTGLPAIDVGNSDEIKVGQYAIAIGCPGGIDFIGSVSYGIISGLNRTITIESIGEMNLIQTDAAINPGNSGGALLNGSGQLIGISSSKLVSESFEGMGFAIPVNTVMSVVKDIIENENNPSPYIGIEIYTYTGDYLAKYHLPRGAAVKSVVTGAPASSAGIRAGDIITEFNNVTINEYTDFIEALNKCVPGANVTVKIYRNNRYYTTTVKVGSNNSLG